MEKLIVISSEDKDSSSVSNSDFIVSFSDSFTQQVSKVLVKEVLVPNCFYNIRSESRFGRPNNELKFFQGSIIPYISATVPQGQYNVTEFMTELTTSLNSALQDDCEVIITLEEKTNVLKFSFSGSGNPVNDYIRFVKDSSMSNVIGFINDVSTDSANIMYMPYTPDLSGLNQVMIHSEQVAETHGLDAGKKGYINLLETVSLHNVEFGSWGYKQNNDDEMSEILYTDNKNLSRIRITLRDNEGNKLDIGTKNMSVVLKAYFSN